MNRLYAFVLVLMAVSCSENAIKIKSVNIANNEAKIHASIVVDDYRLCQSESKSTMTGFGEFNWSEGDRVGIFSHINDVDPNPSTPQLCLTLDEESSEKKYTFSSGSGWKMITGGEYSYFSYYPYSSRSVHDRIQLSFAGQVQDGNGSSAHLSDYDYLYSSPIIPTDQNTAQFTMHHICAFINITVTLPSSFHDTQFTAVRILADNNIFVNNESYSVSSVINNESPEYYDVSLTDQMVLSFKSPVTPNDNILSLWLAMSPSNLKGRQIKIKMYEKNLPQAATAECVIECDNNQSPGVVYSYNGTAYRLSPTHPDKPLSNETLNVLLVGNSHSQDTYDYIHSLLNAAGIHNLNMSYIYRGGGTIKNHYEHHINGEDVPFYDYSDGGLIQKQRTFSEILSEKDWDVVAFQQLSGEYTYSDYQPYLDELVSLARTIGATVHHKIPFIAFNATWSTTGGSTEAVEKHMYSVQQQAYQNMSADTDITWIAPTGTTIENLRNTSLKTPELFLRDGVHLSYGIGRYAASCAWFEAIVKPIYGISVVGNTYRPASTSSSFTGDEVTESNIHLIWDCVSAAMNKPFEVTIVEN